MIKGKNLFEYFTLMSDDDIVLAFNGVMTHDLLVVMAELLKEKYITKFNDPKLTKKLFSVFIELMQNIAYYSKDKVKIGDKSVGRGIILVKELKRGYSIMAGNIINLQDKSKIENKISYINSLNCEELKQLYKKTIKIKREEGQIGGGIGFIDIARKSSDRLVYGFKEIDKDRIFFEINVNIIENKEEKNE